MSNTKIIKTACRQRDDAQRRAAIYKNDRDFMALRLERSINSAFSSTRYGNKMAFKFVKERRKFIGMAVLAALAIAFAVLK